MAPLSCSLVPAAAPCHAAGSLTRCWILRSEGGIRSQWDLNPVSVPMLAATARWLIWHLADGSFSP